jgi:hypothetical protein
MLIIIILIKLIDSISCANDKCCFNTSFAYGNNDYMGLYNFDNFSQLEFNCANPIKLLLWEIRPNEALILDDSLNMANLSIQTNARVFSILFNNIKGFNLYSNPFKDIQLIYSDYIWLRFIDTKFDFYLENSLVNKKLCNQSKHSWDLLSSIKIFELQRVTLFATEICPFVFKNSVLIFFLINRISSSLVEKNILTFQDVFVSDLNSSIYQLELNFYHADLNEKILNKHVFQNLLILDIDGPVRSIQDDLFKSFDYLRIIRLRSQNVKRLFARNNNWLNSLNLKVLDGLILIIYQSLANVSFYDYPNEDFCHFKSYPHKRLVLSVLKPSVYSKCTCLELFLTQYSVPYEKQIKDTIYAQLPTHYAYFEFYTDFIFEKKLFKCVNESFDEVLISCDFEKRLNNCNINGHQVNNRKENDLFLFYVYDWVEMSDLIQIIFSKYVNLVISVIEIVLNFLFILILFNKQIMSDKMYTYLLINSFFNLFYTLIITFKSILNSFENDYYFFNYITTSAVLIQYFNLILVKFASNVFRSSANISYLAFSLSRYVMIANKKGLIFEKFQKLSTIKFLLITLVVSVLINIQIFFQFKIKYSLIDMEQLHPYESKSLFLNYKQDPIEDYKENFSSKSEYILVNLANYFRIIFSDLTHIIATTVIDVYLFIFIKKKIKLSNVVRSNVNINMQIFSRIQNFRKKRRTKKSKDRVSTMIILNGINFTFLRLPLALLSFYGFIFKYNKEIMTHEPNLISYLICKEKRFCASLQEIFFSFYLFSFLNQFFIFYKLDTNFKLSFNEIKTKFNKPQT